MATNVVISNVSHVRVEQKALLGHTGISFVLTYFTFLNESGEEIMSVATTSEKGLRIEQVNESSKLP